jgi:hypothetical protein
MHLPLIFVHRQHLLQLLLQLGLLLTFELTRHVHLHQPQAALDVGGKQVWGEGRCDLVVREGSGFAVCWVPGAMHLRLSPAQGVDVGLSEVLHMPAETIGAGKVHALVSLIPPACALYAIQKRALAEANAALPQAGATSEEGETQQLLGRGAVGRIIVQQPPYYLPLLSINLACRQPSNRSSRHPCREVSSQCLREQVHLKVTGKKENHYNLMIYLLRKQETRNKKQETRTTKHDTRHKKKSGKQSA